MLSKTKASNGNPLEAFVMGLSDLGEKRRSSRREAYRRTSSLENGGRKSPLKFENFGEIQHIIFSFAFLT